MTELLIALLMLILPPCQTEDSTSATELRSVPGDVHATELRVTPWCRWDATSQGNGQGASFVTLTEGLTIHINN